MLKKEGNLDSKPRGNYFKKINPQVLTEYLERHPGAYLCSRSVFKNSAAFHRKKKLESIEESFGHQIIFLPPYSPELNPIEHFWAVLKKSLQNAMTYMPSLDDAIAFGL